ncbi:MFS transporter [Phytoactinopolyspora halotolerans]|uniref:MFS transporter n=1 Tax=Phytoactinopolyspora halotolerans TaxID=1981512 RepID=A0A6L9S3Y9_9ACTN|nr:MFS transporter [Phytoactinopolyspora halotolerans]NED99756.1 MFS transporter [Phytoactinopolyspora halotolerans]
MSQLLTVQSKISRQFVLLGTAQAGLIAAITLITVPLPAIQREFGVSAPDLALLTAAYGLSFGGLLLVGGRLADHIGARRMFVVGMAVFGISSMLGAVAPHYEVLLAARFAQGIGAALVAPAAVALLYRLYPDARERARVLAVWGTLSVAGAVSGSVVSGLIAAVTSWRWTFAIPIAVAAVTLAGVRRLPAAAPVRGTRLRLLDGALVTAGLVTLSHGVLDEAPVTVALGLAVLAGFVLRQARGVEPLLPLGLVTHRGRTTALLVIWLTAAASTAAQFFLSLYFQQIHGWSQSVTSAAFLPFLLVIVMGPVSSRLTRRHGARQVTTVGLLLVAASMALLAFIDVDSEYPGGILVALLLFPLGAGMAFAGATVTAFTDVSAEHSGVAGGVVNTSMEVGPTVGLALLLALSSARTDSLAVDGVTTAAAATGGYAAAFAATAGAFLVTAAVVQFTVRKDASR